MSLGRRGGRGGGGEGGRGERGKGRERGKGEEGHNSKRYWDHTYKLQLITILLSTAVIVLQVIELVHCSWSPLSFPLLVCVCHSVLLTSGGGAVLSILQQIQTSPER